MGNNLRRLLAVLSLLVACAASAPAGAQAPGPDAAALRAQYDTLFQRVLRNPADLDATFQFAEVATKLGEYEAAIGALERILFFNSQLPRIHLELGILYYRLGSYEVARAHLRRAISGPNVPEAVRKRVNEFLAEAERRLADNQFSVQARIGLRYQTNANVAPLGNTYRVFGSEFDLPDSAKKRPDWNGFIQGSVRHVYDLQSQDGNIIETNAQVYGARQFKLSRFDLGLVEIDSGPRLLLTRDGWRPTIRPYVLANYVELGHSYYLGTLGAGAAMTAVFDPTASAELRVEYRHRDFNNSVRNPSVSVQSGDLLQGALSLRKLLMPNLIAWARGTVGINRADQNFYSFHSFQGEAGLVWEFDMPLVKLPAKASFSPFASYMITDYRSPNPLFDPFTTRADREWRVGASLDVPVLEYFGVFAQAQYASVASNIPNFASRNLSLSFGFSVRY